MRWSRRTSILLVYFALICSLCLTVYAHPGRTDGNGGHTDQSTGEYHYHHGYSAHDHYDMDGDGDADCPYDFDDKTGSRSGSSSGSSSYTSSSSSSSSRKEEAVVETVVETVVEEVPYVPNWIKWVIAILTIVVLYLIHFLRSIKNSKKEEIARINDQMRREREQVSERVNGLNKALTAKYGYRYLYEIVSAPEDSYVTKDGLPALINKDKSEWGEKYTFYTASTYNDWKQVKYHERSCRHACTSIAVNALTIASRPGKYVRCKVCCPRLPDVSWVVEYQRNKEFLDGYLSQNNGNIKG